VVVVCTGDQKTQIEDRSAASSSADLRGQSQRRWMVQGRVLQETIEVSGGAGSGREGDGASDPSSRPILGRGEPSLDRNPAGAPERVTIEVVSNDKHIVRMTKPRAGGGIEEYETTYTRRGSSAGRSR
jgi:hypothetical protein